MNLFKIEKLEHILAPAYIYAPVGYPWIHKFINWLLGR